MDLQNMKFWTQKQLAEYFAKQNIDKQDIKFWTCEQLVQYICHELSQKSAITSSILEALLHENGYGFTNEKQKENLYRLQAEVKEIRELNSMLRIWLSRDDEGT